MIEKFMSLLNQNGNVILTEYNSLANINIMTILQLGEPWLKQPHTIETVKWNSNMHTFPQCTH